MQIDQKTKYQIIRTYWIRLANKLLTEGVPQESIVPALSFHLHLMLIDDVYRFLPKSMKPE